MQIVNFDHETIKDTQRHWVDCAIECELDNQKMELTEQFFEHIQESKSYGDFKKRENLNTYIGVSDNENGDCDTLVEVIYHRRGRDATVKLMDIYVNAAIDALEETDYDQIYAERLIFVVSFLMSHTANLGSAAKIYARTDKSQEFLQQLKVAAESMKPELQAARLDIVFEGKRWLAFRTI